MIIRSLLINSLNPGADTHTSQSYEKRRTDTVHQFRASRSVQTQIQTGQLPRGPPQTIRRGWVCAASLIFHGIYDTVYRIKAVKKKGVPFLRTDDISDDVITKSIDVHNARQRRRRAHVPTTARRRWCGRRHRGQHSRSGKTFALS